MRVEEVMSHRVVTVDADDTLTEAAERMRTAVVGALPVLSYGRLVGMVTDRDLVVHAIARRRDGERTRVREVMSRGAITCLPAEDVDEAAARMRQHEIRRLIVVDESELPVGLLSVDDFALYPETAVLALQVLSRVTQMRSVELDGEAERPLH
jgi:CBS domain-containing protein